ncbi:MAG: hypothetical protein IPI35_22555 [Deltaproteobacteria bacterium]|nr:hypothetical protein [Deltaproteobacteria bacterium]
MNIAGEPFEAKGRVRLEAGWQRIDPPMTTRGDELLPTVVEGELGQPHSAELHQGQTRPPKPYNEAAILGAMERAGEGLEEAELRRVMKRGGLGTPATRAAILETLLRRGYIHRVERELRPTPQGRALIEALPVEELRSAKLTGQWEARLAAMAEGEGGRDDFMQDLRAFTAMLVGRILGASLSAGVLRALAPWKSAEGGGGELLGACPLCKERCACGVAAGDVAGAPCLSPDRRRSRGQPAYGEGAPQRPEDRPGEGLSRQDGQDLHRGLGPGRRGQGAV